jgi:hypothetical protein
MHFVWKDRWINGKSISEMAPNSVASVAKRAVKIRTVQEALDEGHWNWITDIRGELSPQAFFKYFQIWDQLQQIQLCPKTHDQHRWLPSSTGIYTSKSAYERFCLGTTDFEPTSRI